MRARVALIVGVVVVAGAALAAALAVTASRPGDDHAGGARPPARCDRHATPATFAKQLEATQPGQALCLAAGAYGVFTGAAKTAPGIIIRGETPATLPAMGLQFRADPVPSWLTLEGLTIVGGDLNGGATHITLRDSRVTGTLQITPGPGPAHNNACGACPQMRDAAITIGPRNTFNNIDPGLNAPEGRLQVNDTGSGPTGLVITSNTFDGGTADGIQASGGTGAFTITRNRFTNIVDCREKSHCADGPHTDALQLTGVGNVRVIDNYFNNDTHGIVAYDGLQPGVVIDGNRFGRIGMGADYWGIVLGGAQSPSILHNRFRRLGPNLTSKAGQTTTDALLRGNVMPGGVVTANGVGGTATLAPGSQRAAQIR